MLYNSILETIGKTPLVRLRKIEEKYNLKNALYAKLESFNPGGSVKDRIAYQMIIDAINQGAIKEGTVIVEPTSGNTGIGLAMVGASLGYEVLLVMPESMSVERRKLMSAYGAKLVLTDAKLGMKGAIDKALELHAEMKNSFMPYQFENPSNPKAHYLTTGKEIKEDLYGQVDYFIAGIGTGGTISGTGKYFKEEGMSTKLIGIEPEGSPVLTEGHGGPHKIQGIGAGFIPKTLDTEIYDKIEIVSNEEAVEKARILAKVEGILVGISSGASFAVALRYAQNPEIKAKNIVFVLPDTGERYLSTDLVE